MAKFDICLIRHVTEMNIKDLYCSWCRILIITEFVFLTFLCHSCQWMWWCFRLRCAIYPCTYTCMYTQGYNFNLNLGLELFRHKFNSSLCTLVSFWFFSPPPPQKVRQWYDLLSTNLVFGRNLREFILEVFLNRSHVSRQLRLSSMELLSLLESCLLNIAVCLQFWYILQVCSVFDAN